jgi:hypothetical protein
VALTKGGKSGMVAMSFGTEFKSGLEVEIVTTNGSVVWEPTMVKTVTRKAEGSSEKVDKIKEFPYSSAVKPEVAAFAKAIEAKAVDPLQTPAEALGDLEILQRLLETGSLGGIVRPVGSL